MGGEPDAAHGPLASRRRRLWASTFVGQKDHRWGALAGRSGLVFGRNCYLVQNKTVTFNVPRELNARVRRLAFHARLSKSSIVEIALMHFLDRRIDNEIVAERLSRGARLRREVRTRLPVSTVE